MGKLILESRSELVLDEDTKQVLEELDQKGLLEELLRRSETILKKKLNEDFFDPNVKWETTTRMYAVKEGEDQ
ncbi:hypothetical protein FDJ58_gp068 [Bacillus phage SIOphi]|uniref:Uncharacterized protein n=1 Tax=Bacillus phage SIOphi TaxID=1285382 RepID=R4JGJ6_9CAUD|nr:hypothetical protein FDJ58_gp068 [Bacillus phage SIOphi]AGK86876.1 hypothetical protein SIOphi_00340 [Bacillus phage SIOphi]